jgi:penicillin amidase
MHKRIPFLILLALVTTGALPQFAAPAQSDALRVAGLKDRVTVRRDERGVPYLEAASDRDLYFAQGYVTASDRLWQMDLLRRSARGELAEIFGKAVFEEDKRRRMLGFAKLSEELAVKLSGETQVQMQAFAEGVNAWIATREAATLPVEFRILKYEPRRWTVADSIVISFFMHESLSTTWQADVMRAALSSVPKPTRDQLLMEFTPMDTPVVGSDRAAARPARARSSKVAAVNVSRDLLVLAARDEALRKQTLARVGLDAEEMAASNNWVVSGKRTATGKPLLANDPHLAASAPGIWYLIHLSAPGVRVAGVSIPGIPAVIIGHNEHIAWGMTNLGPDVQDLYRETFDSEKSDDKNPPRYRTPKGWQQAEMRCEDIEVRKSPTDPETENVCTFVTVTRHGPIVLEKGSERYALRWTVWDTKPEAMGVFHHLNRARNWKEFTSAIRHFGGATQNFVYADVDGHIGYYGAGVIPIRKSGDGSLPYDGSKDDGEWTGWIPFEKLPHVYDPPSGMIVTANARVVGRDYAYHLTHGWSAPYRQKRIHDLLTAKSKLTIEDFLATQGDVYAIGGATFAKAIVKLFDGKNEDPKLAESLTLLAAWDGRATPDSRAALLVHEMRDVFASRVIGSAIGEELAKQYRWTNRHALMDRIVTDWPKEWLSKYHPDWKDFVKSAHDAARANLAKRLGDDESKWTFGQSVQVRLNHPLAVAPLVGNQFKIEPFPQTGNGYAGGLGPTVNVGPTVSMRLVADPSDWDRSRHGILLGQSGDPKSPHYRDQLDEWRTVAPRVFPFSREAVMKAAKQTMVLNP